MSTILGGAVKAEAEDRPTQTSCTYTAASGISPYAELKVTWGDGEVGMMGAGLARRLEPGLTDPLAGLGDQASSMGTGFMIRTGEDLITVVFSGVDEPVEKAKRIVATMRPRMGPTSQPSASRGADRQEADAAHAPEAADEPKMPAEAQQLLNGLLGGLAAGDAKSARSAAQPPSGTPPEKPSGKP